MTYKATSCPNCGCPISNNHLQTNESIMDNKTKDDNTVEIYCDEFGGNVQKRNKRKIAIILIAIVCVIAIAASISIAIISNNRKKEKEAVERTRITYIDNLNKLKELALTGAAEVEVVGGTIHDIW